MAIMSKSCSITSAVAPCSMSRESTSHVLGIDEEFGLKVQYEDGNVEILRSGEISIRI